MEILRGIKTKIPQGSGTLGNAQSFACRVEKQTQDSFNSSAIFLNFQRKNQENKRVLNDLNVRPPEQTIND